ncbi:uncharacterized protein N7518_001734 [Penicillium psychrosexuale]|uniref:uncharacterized protein n=1 Tax=Penicillium psychrosexuale TaxID=1002107 RepID=UPI00254556DE|nr:uncharacterized protein N7518_001734 [Penicillium psychrosexuale]KAJ5799666.1 hypothetical protein N7518_001734 [Penicillium psychrosexuale]
MPKRFLAISELDSVALINICEDFEQSDVQAPVLSVYETKPTKLKERFWLSRSEVFVDKTLARTWALEEKLLPSDANHDAISTFQPQSTVHQEIGLLLMSALQMHQIAMTKSAINAPNPTDLWKRAISYASVSRNPQSKQSPPEAQLGSSIPSSFDHVPSQDPTEYVKEETLPSRPCWEFEPFGHEEEFVGRDDVFDMIDHVFDTIVPDPAATTDGSSTHELTCCSISGLGGIGKTQTAIEYAWSRRKFFDAVFVVQADGAANLSDNFAGIASKLGILDPMEKSEKSREETDLIVSRSKAMKWLSAPKFAPTTSDDNRTGREIPWLLIFDNVEDASLLRDYWPVGSEGCILVTTRDERAGDYLRSQGAITLDRLSTKFGADLLLRLSYLQASNINLQDASAIVERVDGLPIAIEKIAAYIYRKSMSLKEFLKLYDKSLLARSPSEANESWSHTIATSWALDDLNVAATALIETFACLHPVSIQGSAEKRPDVQPSLVGFPIDALEYIAARSELAKGSLIRFNMETEVVIMHRLVQDIVLARMSDARRLATCGFAIRMLLSAWPTTSHNFEHETRHWTVKEGLRQHILRLAEIARKYSLDRLDLPTKRSFVKLLQNGGWDLQERGNFVDGKPLYALAVDLCENNSEAMLDLRADIAFNLANVASETNQFQSCLKHVREHLHLRLRLDAGNELASADTGIAYSSLGLGLLLTGKYEEAVKQCDKSIEIYGKRPETLDNTFYPTFPHIHRALALTGAGRPGDAEDGLLGGSQVA